MLSCGLWKIAASPERGTAVHRCLCKVVIQLRCAAAGAFGKLWSSLDVLIFHVFSIRRSDFLIVFASPKLRKSREGPEGPHFHCFKQPLPFSDEKQTATASALGILGAMAPRLGSAMDAMEPRCQVDRRSHGWSMCLAPPNAEEVDKTWRWWGKHPKYEVFRMRNGNVGGTCCFWTSLDLNGIWYNW